MHIEKLDEMEQVFLFLRSFESMTPLLLVLMIIK